MKKWIIAVACICVVNIVLGRPIEEFDLREFCGFRFNSPHSDSSDTNRFVEVDLEKPFRLFKKAELGYTSDNKLYSIGLKLQDRMMSSCGIAIPQLSKGATLGVTLEAMQEEHNDLVEWAETEYGIKFRKTKKLGEPAFYSFGNTNIRISVSRLNMFGANQLSFTVSDAQLLDKIMLAEQKEKEEKQKRERELSLRKNEFGRNKAEQAEFEKTVNLKLFWGFEFGKSFENQPITFDALTLEQMKKGRSYLFPRGKLKKPFLQIEDVSLHIDRATRNLTMVSLKKAYSNVPLNEQSKLARESKYERPGLYERQKWIVDWFSKEYKIVLVEDKIWHTFTFRNDYAFIEVKRTSYNDTIEILVSGNKTPAKKENDKPAVVIPAESFNIDTFNAIQFL